MMLRLVAVVSIASLLAGSALAQEAIPTAQGATPPDASKEPPPPPLGARAKTDFAPVQPGPCGTGPTPKMAPVGPDGEPAVDHDPHGEVSVGAGTHGYRSIAGAVCVPVGDNGFVAVDVSQDTYGGGRRR